MTMRAIVEFGVRGGNHSSFVCSSAQQAAKLACKMSYVFGREHAIWSDFQVKRNMPRRSWQSSTHFVSVSILDGVPRGSDTASWRKESA